MQDVADPNHYISVGLLEGRGGAARLASRLPHSPRNSVPTVLSATNESTLASD